jgi:hypothetical protein
MCIWLVNSILFKNYCLHKKCEYLYFGLECKIKNSRNFHHVETFFIIHLCFINI